MKKSELEKQYFLTLNSIKDIIDEFRNESAELAPDVLGLRIKDKIVPFAVFDEKWTPKADMPQIEVKTFKKPQQMVSLRNQGYNGKYLVMVESNYRIDYLLPFFDNSYLSKDIYDKMTMDDNTFIVSNSKGLIKHLNVVNYDRQDLGTLKLLTITKTEEFEKVSTYCEPGVSPIRISSIEEKKQKEICNEPFSKYCSKQSSNLYRFNDSWYDGNEDGITYFNSKPGKKIFARTLDFDCSDISCINLIKRNKDSFYIKTSKDCLINHKPLKSNTVYKISLTILPREGTDNGEYFLQKDLIDYIPNYENQLVDTLKKIVNEE